MNARGDRRGGLRSLLAALALSAGCCGALGCQGSYGGQTLPSPYYLSDDVQYYAPGPEMKLAREAAAMRQAAAEEVPAAE